MSEWTPEQAQYALDIAERERFQKCQHMTVAVGAWCCECEAAAVTVPKGARPAVIECLRCGEGAVVFEWED